MASTENLNEFDSVTINMTTPQLDPLPRDELELAASTESAKNKMESTEVVLVADNREAKHSRIPYDNGYGDFCFGRWASRERKSSWDGTIQDQKFWEDGSNGTIVPELGGFKRTGSFPFFKLPLHIRNLIYRLLLGPVYQYSWSGKSSYICLRVGEPRMSFDNRYDQDYDHFLAKEKGDRNLARAFASFGDERVQESDESIEPPSTVQEYEEKKAVHDPEYALHPFRKTHYKLQLFPLEKLQVNLTMAEDDVEGMLSNETLTQPLSLTRRLRVSENFLVRPHILLTNLGNFDSDEEEEKYQEELEDKYAKILTDLMLPNTLRQQPAKNDMEAYLQFRSGAPAPERPSSPAPSACGVM
ncbi:uncharacterized protein PAC_00053 [Phialocephala subalpina]|uniref:Uncharacterized protein n=1 Tax=Phialocephala subalpina TaxID=576137 RepID=A0A1L7WBN5_9HELO|nr:uncharacterized protein PAC_00053 [Phialocephala subalpina]